MSSIRLGAVATLVSKGTTPTSVGLSFAIRGTPFLRAEDVMCATVDPVCAQMFISLESHQALRRSAIKPNDVLVTIAGTIGRVGVVVGDGREANCNQAVAIIRVPPEQIDPMWLCLLLRSPAYQKQFDGFIAGGAIPNVSLTQIRSIALPDIPIRKQRETVAALHSKLLAADSASIAARKQLRELSALSNAIVFDSLKDTGRRTANIGECLDEVKRGVGPTWKKCPVLGATRAGLAPARERPGKHPERYKPAFPGTVFYNPMRILIGSIAFVDDDDRPGITSPDYVALVGKAGVIDTRWFYHWMRSPLGEQCINSLARGAVRERMLFNRLAEGQIELPDFPRQVVASKALAQVKPMRRAIEKQFQELELIPHKLLAHVFES
jgi:type I restriction enzyme, S subunit